jgi:hypothetical protein
LHTAIFCTRRARLLCPLSVVLSSGLWCELEERMSNVRGMYWRALVKLVLLLLAFGSLGSQCTTTPAKCGLPACKQGEVRACINKCVVPVPLNGACSDDPCAPNGICAQAAICKNGVCKEPNHGLATTCDPGKPDQCSASTYCHREACVPGSGASRCALPATESQPCDSSFASYKAESDCIPCEPGLKCVNGFCHEKCASAADCPCDNSKFVCSSNLCFRCHDLGQDCDAETKCCGGASCSAGRCCMATGNACSGQGDCCGTDVCLGAKCTACKKAGEGCSTSAQCCSGTSCKGGVCAIDCTAGQSCQVPGKKGECDTGTTVCSATTKGCQETVFPKPEVCDKKDNDCDGITDNVVFNPATCTTTRAGCQSSFHAAGTRHCENGNEVCTVGAVCTICGTGCGTCKADPCTPGVSKCTPGFTCKSAPPSGCGIPGPFNGNECWPIDASHCQGCSGVSCWTSSDLSVSGACPP